MSAPFEITLAAFTKGMEEAALARWIVPEGGWAAEGDVLAEVETDKATMEIEAPCDGVLTRRLVSCGAKKWPVGAALALFAPGPKPEPGAQPAISAPAVGLTLAAPPAGPSVTMTLADAVRAGLAEAMRVDPRVRLIAEDARAGGRRGVWRGLAAEFPSRALEASADSAAALDRAVGALLAGAVPALDLPAPGRVPPAALDALARRAARFEAPALAMLRVDARSRFAPPAGARVVAPCS